MSDWQWLATLLTEASNLYQGKAEGELVYIAFLMTVSASDGTAWFASGYGNFLPGQKETLEIGYPPKEFTFFTPASLNGLINNSEVNKSGPAGEFENDFLPGDFSLATITVVFGGGLFEPYQSFNPPNVVVSAIEGPPSAFLTDVSTDVECVLSGVGPYPVSNSSESALYTIWFAQPELQTPNY